MDQEKIGRFIGRERKKLGITQERLGEMLGVTNKTISRWETGKYMPDIDKLQELSSILGVSVNEFLSGEHVEDTARLMKRADENLVAALARDPVFGWRDRIAYYKRKWIGEHRGLIAMWIAAWSLVCFAGVYMKQPGILAFLPIAGIAIYGWIRNRMMAYAERRAFSEHTSSEE